MHQAARGGPRFGMTAFGEHFCFRDQRYQRAGCGIEQKPAENVAASLTVLLHLTAAALKARPLARHLPW